MRRSQRERERNRTEEEEDNDFIKMDRVSGRGQGVMSVLRGGASVWRGLRAERRQRGGEHQHFGLHEGEIGQTGDHFGRLLAQILLLPRLPVRRSRRQELQVGTTTSSHDIT